MFGIVFDRLRVFALSLFFLRCFCFGERDQTNESSIPDVMNVTFGHGTMYRHSDHSRGAVLLRALCCAFIIFYTSTSVLVRPSEPCTEVRGSWWGIRHTPPLPLQEHIRSLPHRRCYHLNGTLRATSFGLTMGHTVDGSPTSKKHS